MKVDINSPTIETALSVPIIGFVAHGVLLWVQIKVVWGWLRG